MFIFKSASALASCFLPFSGDFYRMITTEMLLSYLGISIHRRTLFLSCFAIHRSTFFFFSGETSSSPANG
ncbi:hypothetical protein Hanom_Chr06g00514621 [Helianthus anomalus]